MLNIKRIMWAVMSGLFFILPVNVFSAAIDNTQLAPRAFAPQGGQQASAVTSFFFSDNYLNADSATPPTYNETDLGAGGAFGSPLALKFSSSGSSSTPVLPLDGFYEISFSIYIRNNSPIGSSIGFAWPYGAQAPASCNAGVLALNVYITSTDATIANVYGCQAGSGGDWPQPSCAQTFSQWMQCAWQNNNLMTIYNYWYQGLARGFPYFMYTPAWPTQPYSMPYAVTTANAPYPEFINYNNMWSGGTLHDNRTPTSGPAFFSRPPFYARQTEYCRAKKFHFKAVAYLHKGATVSAPLLQSQSAQGSYGNQVPGPRSISSLPVQPTACGFSVIGGDYKVKFLHS